MRKTFLRQGGLIALLAVALGAFGAHSLREAIQPEQLHTFEIGVRYQFYHALAIVAVGLLLYFRKTSLLPWAGRLFTAGIVLFSGSLYLLAMGDLLPFSVEWLGPVTPVGGVLLILGWLTLVLSTYQENERAYRASRSDSKEEVNETKLYQRKKVG